METRFVKAYIDEVSFSNLTSEDRDLLKKYGYTEDEHGEVAVSFKFGDGIAYVPNGCGLVLRYPTLYEVSQSAEMQKNISEHTSKPDIIPYDIAVTYGRLGEYKYVLDYDVWVDQGENSYKDICSIHRMNGEFTGTHAFDVFEEEFNELCDKDVIECETASYMLKHSPTEQEIERLQAEYGILWTECIGTHVFDKNGYLERYKEVELTSAEKVVKMAERISAMGGTMVIWNDKEFHFASQSGWQYRTDHGEMWVKEVKPSILIVTDGEKNWEIPMWMMIEKMMHQVFMTFKAVCKRNLTDIGYKRVMSAIGE